MIPILFASTYLTIQDIFSLRRNPTTVRFRAFVVRSEKFFPVTARSAIVHIEHHITVVDQVLTSAIRHARLAAGPPAPSLCQAPFSKRSRRSADKNGRDFHPVERFEAHDFAIDEIVRIDLRIQTTR